SAVEMGTNVVTATPTEDGGTNGLRLNFRNAPIDLVLNYLSDAAGFIIELDTSVHGNVSVISSHPMTQDEAVALLNSVLNKNGYAAIRNGRTLTIVNKDDAKTRDIPVQVGNDPQSVPKNDEIVTQIIPVRYVDASQLISDLSSFVSPQATVVANQAGNSIVITDTQENIRHLMEIISAIDSSAAGETEIRVFPLSFANPNDVAAELGQIFPSGGSGNGLSPIAFRGPGGGGFGGGGFGGGGFGGGGGGGFFARMAAAAAGNNSNGNRAQKQSQVTAVADPRTQSVIVMASKDLMLEITSMMQELDVPSSRDQQVHVIHLDNADPQQVLQVLQGTFPQGSVANSSSSSTSSQTDARQEREQQNATTVSQTSTSLSSGTGTGVGRGAGGGGAP
ncbi:MAG TPA: secretin N-terminal domain-containing protein, partial [Candidatus Acidoferrales bacterium]|nr:secretin N-terminal domain-containing protein [Candidatus Acidoferrales bacterium]